MCSVNNYVSSPSLSYIPHSDASPPASQAEGLTPAVLPLQFKETWPSSAKSRTLHSISSTLNQKPVSFTSLRRAARGFIKLSLGRSPALHLQGRPTMPDPAAMCSPVLLLAGPRPLTDCPLNPDIILSDHRRHHQSCNKDCYIHLLVNVARCGFHINRVHRSKPATRCLRSLRFNHAPFNAFGTASDAALAKQVLQCGATRVIPVTELTNGQEKKFIFSPLLSVIRNTDLWRASIVGIDVKDEFSLGSANAVLDPNIKIRACLDLTSSGVNATQPEFPFYYMSLDDAIAQVTPNCWMAKIDLQGMFNSIGLSLPTRRLFCFRDRQGQTHQYIRAPFGGKLFPAVASAFMSEIMFIAQCEGVPCVSYVDDFFVAGNTYAECLFRRNHLMTILRQQGWTINMDKVTLPAQQMDFLGVLIDSVRMIISVIPEKASVVNFKLERVLQLVATDPPSSIRPLTSLLGSLSWMSAITLVGRMWNMSLFKMLQSINSTTDLVTSTALLVSCAESVSYWRTTLTSWSKGNNVASNIRILPPLSLTDALFVQTDAGDEGLGYWFTTPQENFRNLTWAACTLPSCQSATSSTWKELNTVLWALQQHPEWNGQSIIFVLDSAVAAFDLNSGTCYSGSFATLCSILSLCSSSYIHLVALWVPREENTFADYLTHHCVISRKDADEGVVHLGDSGDMDGKVVYRR